MPPHTTIESWSEGIMHILQEQLQLEEDYLHLQQQPQLNATLPQQHQFLHSHAQQEVHRLCPFRVLVPMQQHELSVPFPLHDHHTNVNVPATHVQNKPTSNTSPV